MNPKRHGSIPDEWDNFSVPGISSPSAGKDLFASFERFKDRFQSLPKGELIKRGWIKDKTDTLSLAHYFIDVHNEGSSTLFRKSTAVDTSLSSLWLSKVRNEAQDRFLTEATPPFVQLQKKDLIEIAQLSIEESVIKKLPEILASRGVILVYLRSLPRMKLDGAVFKMSSGNPVVGMSLRYPRLDYFWFTLLHELSHIVLHWDLLNEPILDDLQEDGTDTVEVSANRLTKASFVERSIWRNCDPKYSKNEESIIKFATQVNIHPSIIAGMIRKEEGDFKSYSKIVNKTNIREVIFGND